MTGKSPSTSRIARLLFGLLAYVSLGIGLVAIVVPGLPTTEFILLAAWAATKSSPRLSAWLENHRLFGPILFNWRNGKIIARRAKIRRHRQHAALCPTDAADARSRLADLPDHRRNEPGQPVDMVPPGTACTPRITRDVGVFLPFIASLS